MTTLTIEQLGAKGDGIAGGYFVPYTLPGEVVEIEGDSQRPLLKAIIKPSAERVEAPCPAYMRCGGCALQHWQFDKYLGWKQQLVEQMLQQAGLETEVRPIIDAHGEGRRRATIHARKGADGLYHVGFNAAREHRVIDIDTCLLLAPQMREAFAFANLLTERLKGSGSPIDYHITTTLNGLDIDICGVPQKARPSDKTMIALADRPGLARLTWNGQLIMQRQPPTIMIGDAKVTLPPAAFLQATVEAQDVLSHLVLGAMPAKSRQILDLFCGVGTFTFPLAQLAKVKAADSSKEAIAALADAARHLRGIKTIETEARDLFRRPYLPMDLKYVDTIVFDPPRAGAEIQVAHIGKSAVSHIIAVSCNLTTFIRDMRVLVGNGFRLKYVTPVDQFRYSAHVEIVAALSR